MPFAIEVTEVEPERSIGFRTLAGPFAWHGRWEVRAMDAGNTEVTATGTIRMFGLRRLLEPFMGGEIQKSETKELVRLRDVLEGRSAART